MNAIKWCGVCNGAPAAGVLEVLEKSTGTQMPLDVCQHCVYDIVHGNVDWIENGIV